jgi:hypothetical protein
MGDSQYPPYGQADCVDASRFRTVLSVGNPAILWKPLERLIAITSFVIMPQNLRNFVKINIVSISGPLQLLIALDGKMLLK